jgi:hypothetical protein
MSHGEIEVCSYHFKGNVCDERVPEVDVDHSGLSARTETETLFIRNFHLLLLKGSLSFSKLRPLSLGTLVALRLNGDGLVG